MAELEFSESDDVRRLEYYDEDRYISLQIYPEDAEFACFWTPKLDPFTTLRRLRDIGFIPLRHADGLLEWTGGKLETRHWNSALHKAQSIPLQELEYLRLGSNVDSIILQRSPFQSGHCCGMGGQLKKLRHLGTAVTLTAPPLLIPQFHAMYNRLIGSYHAPHMTTHCSGH